MSNPAVRDPATSARQSRRKGFAEMAAAVERVRAGILRRLGGREGKVILACLPDPKGADLQLAQMVVAQVVARRLAGFSDACATGETRTADWGGDMACHCLSGVLDWAAGLEVDDDLSRLAFGELETGDRGQADAVLHFFEQFLGSTDRGQRRRRGVFYTPSTVAAFIVRQIDARLREECGIVQGLASRRVSVLDPAAGTGSFLVEVLRSIHATLAQEWQSQGLSLEERHRRWQAEVPGVLPRLTGWEILPAACAVAQVRLAMALRETGYELNGREAFRLFLTDSLTERRTGDAGPLPASERTVTVIVGNPPFGVGVSRSNPWLDRLCEPIRAAVRTERNRQPLADAYIHFLALACELARGPTPALLGMVVNRSCFDGRLHRGLRQLLAERFSRVSLVDLGGETRNGISSVRDQNVFEITQGVGIIFGSPGRETVEGATLDGSRGGKLAALAADTLSWNPIPTQDRAAPWRWTCPANTSSASIEAEYQRHPSLAELMPFRSPGVKTSCDSIAYAFTVEELEAQVRGAGWTWDSRLAMRSLYRPGDIRWLYYEPARLGRPRPELARHVLAEDVPSLIAMRQSVGNEFSHIALCRGLACHGVFYLGNRGQDYQFPLTVSTPEGRRPNLSIERLPQSLHAPERFASYAAAILLSTGYRTRYRDLLPRDFPRIPILEDADLTESLVRLGSDWSAEQMSHYAGVRDSELGVTNLTWKVDGESPIGRRHPAFSDDRVWLSEASCIEGVTADDWEAVLGGYRVCETFWKSRRRRNVSSEDLHQFSLLIATVRRTKELQREIDALLPRIE